MPSLKDIKLRITSVRNTQKTTRAMKMVSAAKLRKAQDAIIRLRPYANKLNELLGRVVASLGEDQAFQSPYVDDGRAVGRVLVVLVSSNRGLAGSFNSAIIKTGATAIEQDYATYQRGGTLDVLAIGRRGYDWFARKGYRMRGGANRDVFAALSYETVEAVADELMAAYVDGSYDRVVLVYNEFKNVMSQVRRVEQLLPVQAPTAESTGPDTSAKGRGLDYLYEPGQETILTELIPQIIKTRLYRAILESHAAEHGARMFAMDNATENAEELIKSLRLQYNKARQAAITKELIEIVSGAEALNAG